MTRTRTLLQHLPAQSRRLQRTRKPRAIATASQSEPRRRANSRATAQCLRSPPLLLPRRRFATALASDKAARQLATCRQLPCRGLHHARGCATGFLALAIAVLPAPTFGLTRLGSVLPAACAVSFAHGFFGYIKHSLLAVLDCTQPVRGKSQAIKHNSALPKVGRSPFRCAPSPAYRCAPCGFG